MSVKLKTEKIGIIGSGLIGRSWAMLFASVGYQVVLYDIVPDQVNNALKQAKDELFKLEKEGTLRGTLSAKKQFDCIQGTTDIQTLVKDAILIQECIPENLELKKKLYRKLDSIIESNTIISSSTSTFLPSVLSNELQHKSQIVVSHPVNPPYYVPLVEIVPAPWTKPEIIQMTKNIMTEIGQKPVCLNKEIEGFALNRIQYVILNESWRLIENGVLDAQEIDTVMSDGLGMRYAFLGPLETAHLNAEGMKSYCERYSKSIYDVSKTMGEIPRMEGKMVDKISKQLEKFSPLNKLKERRNWRDSCLTKLSQLKQEINQNK